jgi:hypothetical protein
VCKLSTSIASLNLPTFWISSFVFEGLCSCVQQLLVMIGVVHFTIFFVCLVLFVVDYV